MEQGHEVIDHEDIASKDPLVIEFAEDVTVFSFEISGSSGKANDFRIQRINQSNLWTVEFDFVGWREGVTLRMMHSAIPNRPVVMRGTIKGGSSIKYVHPGGYMGIVEDAMNRRYDPFLKRFEPKSSSGPAYRAYWITVFFVAAVPYMIISLPFGLANLVRRPVNKVPIFETTSQ